MSPNDGGPAFPVPGLQDDASFNGMTLRDYFAAKAMAIIAQTAEHQHVGPVEYAMAAYEIADAMLRQRSA